MSRKVLTLVFLRKEGEVLLGYKKRGLGAASGTGLGGRWSPGRAWRREPPGRSSASTQPLLLRQFNLVDIVRPVFVELFFGWTEGCERVWCVEAGVREVLEECGLVVEPSHLTEAGQIEFEFKGDPVKLEVHVFQVNEF